MPEFKLPIALKAWVSKGLQAVLLATMTGVLASCSNVSRTKSAFAPSEGGGGRNMGDLSSPEFRCELHAIGMRIGVMTKHRTDEGDDQCHWLGSTSSKAQRRRTSDAARRRPRCRCRSVRRSAPRSVSDIGGAREIASSVLDTGLGMDRSERFVLVEIISRVRSRTMKLVLYETLARSLRIQCGIDPSGVMVSILKNSDEDWSFGMGRAQVIPEN